MASFDILHGYDYDYGCKKCYKQISKTSQIAPNKLHDRSVTGLASEREYEKNLLSAG